MNETDARRMKKKKKRKKQQAQKKFLLQKGQQKKLIDKAKMVSETINPNATSLQQAITHHQAGRFQQAERIYRQIIKAEPENADAYHLLGVVAHQTGRCDIAVQLISKAIEKDSNQHSFYSNLGNILKAQDKLDDAIKSYKKALDINPDFADAHYNLGLAFKDQGKLDDAITSFQRALSINPGFADAHNNLGNVLKAQGKLDDAIKSYKKALSINPDFAEVHNNLGSTLGFQGKLDDAITSYKKALSINPDFAEVYSNLGSALEFQGKLDDAIESYQRLLIIKPESVHIHYDLGNLLKEQGRLEEAAVSYRKALSLKPEFVEAHNNLGNTLKEQGRLQEAVACLEMAISIKPEFVEAHNNLGNTLKEQGGLEEAGVRYRKAISLKPEFVDAHYNLGNTLKELGCLEEAAASYRKALSIKPDYIEAHNNLGNTLKELGRLEEAIVSYQKALSIKPDYIEARNNLGNAFKEQGCLEEAAASYRKALTIKPEFAEVHNNLGNILKEQGRLEEAVVCLKKALSIKPEFVTAHSNLLCCLNYFPNISREDIYNESLKWDQQHAKTLLKKEPVYHNKKEKERKLRIGYVSPDFRDHSVAFFFEPLLKAHNKEKFEIYSYSNVKKPDNVTGRLKAEANHWFSIVGKKDEDIADQIERDEIDILVDLAGHTENNRLLVFAYKPAPIQVTWLGYPNTTGMSAIDYRFTDEIADPVSETKKMNSEELIRLGSGFLCYNADDFAPEISALPCLERGYITFGSFNNLTKTTPEVVKLWSDILHRVPNALLLLKCNQLLDEEMREKYRRMFEKTGISGDRIELFGTLPKKADHLGLYSKIDIGLDPFPYNGTTTTCEALWMGVPVVTMLGDRHAGRVGASILKHVGLGKLIADSPKSYVEIARQLSTNVGKLAALRNGLRDQMISSPLCDAGAFTKNVEEVYIRMWERYIAICEGKLISQSMEKDSQQPSDYSELGNVLME
jgi:predicted O-linked N-acetylglucosamine transferase (SPINDLY family)